MIPHNSPTVPSTGIVIPFPATAIERGEKRPLAERIRPVLSWLERALDFVTVMTAVLLAYLAGRACGVKLPAQAASSSVVLGAAVAAGLFVLLLDKHGEYRPCLSLLAIRESERWLRVLAETAWLAAAVMVCATGHFPLRFLVLATVSAGALLAAQKLHVRRAVGWVRSRGWGMRRAVIVGAGPLGRKVYSALARSPKFGLEPVAFVDEDAAFGSQEIHELSYRSTEAAKILTGPLSPRLFRNLNASVLVIADPDLDGMELEDTIADAGALGVTSYVVSKEFEETGSWISYSELDGLTVAKIAGDEPAPRSDGLKRLFDIGVAGVSLCLAAPLMLLAAVLVKLTSPGPVLFRQLRLGKNGRRFSMYKFRTMEMDGEATPPSRTLKEASNPRVTRIGRILRKSNIDELPQLFNVLVGDMSLVGPRPEIASLDIFYHGIQRKRLAVTPGMTGLWQLSVHRNSPIYENTEYDLYYARHRNFFMDLAILIHTLWFGWQGV